MFEVHRNPAADYEFFTLYSTNFTVPDNAGLLVLRDKPLRLFVFSQDMSTTLLLV